MFWCSQTNSYPEHNLSLRWDDRVIDLTMLFIVSNTAFLFGTGLLMRQVIKNRNVLDDYDVYGSFLNVVGMALGGVILVELNQWLSLALQLPTLIFWVIVTVLSVRRKMKGSVSKCVEQ